MGTLRRRTSGRLVEILGSRVTPIDSLGVDRVATCLNNTLKGCIVNFVSAGEE